MYTKISRQSHINKIALFIIAIIAVYMLQGCMFGGEIVNETSRTVHTTANGYTVDIEYDNGGFCTEFHSSKPMVVKCGRGENGYKVEYDFGEGADARWKPIK